MEYTWCCRSHKMRHGGAGGAIFQNVRAHNNIQEATFELSDPATGTSQCVHTARDRPKSRTDSSRREGLGDRTKHTCDLIPLHSTPPSTYCRSFRSFLQGSVCLSACMSACWQRQTRCEHHRLAPGLWTRAHTSVCRLNTSPPPFMRHKYLHLPPIL